MTFSIGRTRVCGGLILILMAVLLVTTGLLANAMNEAELVEYLYKNEGEDTKATAERILNAVLDAVKSGLKKDGQVQLIGFGNFTSTKEPQLRIRIECTHDTLGTSCYLQDGSGCHSDRDGKTSCLILDNP